jgi:hypothetical protein
MAIVIAILIVITTIQLICEGRWEMGDVWSGQPGQGKQKQSITPPRDRQLRTRTRG